MKKSFKIKMIAAVTIVPAMIFATSCTKDKNKQQQMVKEGSNIAVEVVNVTAQTAVTHTEDALTDTVSSYANQINNKITSYTDTASGILEDAGADTLKETLDTYVDKTTSGISKAEDFINSKISGTAGFINTKLSDGSKFAKEKLSEQIDKGFEKSAEKENTEQTQK